MNLNDAPTDVTTLPWEGPGAVRRDYSPHRGSLLRPMGVTGMVLGALAVPTLIPAVVSLPLCAGVRAMALRDLDRIRRGLVDPDGQEPAVLALADARAGIIATVFAAAVWGMIVLLALVQA